VVVQPGTAILLGEGHPHQPKFAHLADEIGGELVLVVDFLGDGDDLLVDELRDHISNLLLLGRECEIHITEFETSLLYCSLFDEFVSRRCQKREDRRGDRDFS